MKFNSFYAGAALALVIAAGGPAWAQDTAEAENRAHVQENVTSETDSQLSEKRATLIKEAVDALNETNKAIAAIENGNTEEALAALAMATGKLETVVAREPDLALAPVDVNYVTYDVLASLETIKAIGEEVEDLVEDGKFQDARALLSNFASEAVIRTTSLPLATYPDAILEATALLDDGKTEEATTVLNIALSTQVVTETVIPLPTLRAEAMIANAEALLNSDGDAATGEAVADDAQLTPAQYVEAARLELKIAEALGYGSESDFEDLHEALDELDRKIEAQQDTGSILEKISTRFEELRERILD